MLALIPLLLNAVLLYGSVKRGTPWIGFFIGALLVFSAPHAYNSLFNASAYSSSTYLLVSLHASILFSVLGLTYALLWGTIVKRRGRLPDPMESSRQAVQTAWVRSIILMVLGFSLVVAAIGFRMDALFYSTWTDFRSDDSRLKFVGTMFVYSACSFSIVAISRKRKGALAFALIAILAVILVLKTRSYLVALIAPALVYLIAFRRITVRRGTILMCLIVFGYFAYSSARTIRLVGSISQLTLADVGFSDIGEFQLIQTLYYLVENGWSPPIEFQNFLRLGSFFVPERWIPGGRPPDLSITLWTELMNMSSLVGSLHPTVVGDSMLTSPLLGSTVLGCFYGGLFFLVDFAILRIQTARLEVFALASFVGFYFARGAFYNGIIILIICTLLLMATALVMRMRIGRGAGR